MPNLDHKQHRLAAVALRGRPKNPQGRLHLGGGKAKSGETITGWTAEVFVPYELLQALRNVPPQPGTRWRANFYRCDYDDNQETSWSWTPVGSSFHEYEKFGTLRVRVKRARQVDEILRPSLDPLPKRR